MNKYQKYNRPTSSKLLSNDRLALSVASHGLVRLTLALLKGREMSTARVGEGLREKIYRHKEIFSKPQFGALENSVIKNTLFAPLFGSVLLCPPPQLSELTSFTTPKRTCFFLHNLQYKST